MKKHSTVLFPLILGALLWTSAARAESAAVIFMYQRVGEDSVPGSNLPLGQFEEHMRALASGGYNVLPLDRIVAALKSGDGKLPPKTVALTFEGAWLPTMDNVLPVLKKHGFPFTVFFASDMADRDSPHYMNRAALKALKKNKNAALGLLPASYTRMTGNTPEENAALLNRATGRYREMFGGQAPFFVWPYGEYTAALQKQAADYGFQAALGQHAGVAHAGSDFMALPRFAMTEAYGGPDRFRLTADALPLPVKDVLPEDPLVTQNPPMIGFTVAPGVADLSRLSCFVSGVGKVPLLRPGGGRVEIRLDAPLQDRKTRVNCTLREDDPAVWRWFGMMLVAPGAMENEDGGG